MAQDPERDNESQERGSLDMSHDLDMVPLYFSQAIEAESEADVIVGILDSNGIPSTRDIPQFPNLGITIRVPRHMLAEAQRLIEEQRAAGPEAAADAEAASEDRQ